MKIAAKTEISPHEEALIQDFIKQMKQEHPNLELSMNDIYDSALRTGIAVSYTHLMYELTQSMESLSVDEIIVYLRKSRSDSPEMSVEDVLKKHEEMIQDYACLLYTSRCV